MPGFGPRHWLTYVGGETRTASFSRVSFPLLVGGCTLQLGPVKPVGGVLASTKANSFHVSQQCQTMYFFLKSYTQHSSHNRQDFLDKQRPTARFISS